MQVIIVLTLISILGVIAVKCMKREDEIIELEDRIIADIRDFLRGGNKRDKTAKIEKVPCISEGTHGRAA